MMLWALITATSVSIPEMLVFALFVVFLGFAVGTEAPFLYALSGLFGMLLGAMFGLAYIAEQVSLWYFGIIGEALILFGLWLLIASIYKNLER